MVVAVDPQSTTPKNKKIVFDDDGEIVEKSEKKRKNKKKTETHAEVAADVKTEDNDGDDSEEDAPTTEQHENQTRKSASASQKWFQVYPQYPATAEILDMKESEQMELYNTCRTSYEQEKSHFMKKNPSDARWLQTALHKGTAKDRANAGALLVTSNAMANLEALTTLVGFCKVSNKSCVDVIVTVSELWKTVLLPSHRKLYSIPMRGADWKLVRKSTTLTKEQQRRIYAYWHFENELKDIYFEFLKNLQQGIQTGQENNKTVGISAASQLLSYAPEKEQMLLTMLINKFGDPVPKVASKALYHLTDLAHHHTNMCGVIVAEAEKLLFRNNVSERAQHYALCFLSGIAPAGKPDVCTKLVNICFSLFKVLVQRGSINSRTMQAILRCLQKAIVQAKPAAGSSEILSKEMQDTIYRLVHLADIRISIQTLGLLLQLVAVKTENSSRFYNALYKKLLDLNLIDISSKTAAHLLHILHRAIFIDSNVSRARAFIKRLLQFALYAPSHVTAGCLIVINKLHQTRKELRCANANDAETSAKVLTEEELKKFDSDEEEKYIDVPEATDVADSRDAEPKHESDEKTEKTGVIATSWHHSKVRAPEESLKTRELSASKYDPYHRVPEFAGVEFSWQNELLLLSDHEHPTVKVFAESLLNNKPIDYYGDPLRDFSLAHFLERFSFKNPKKLDSKPDTTVMGQKSYTSYGARGMPVKSLTKKNCSVEEMFLSNYLEHKAQQSALRQDTKKTDEDEEKLGDVDDDEFDEYLDGFFSKKKKGTSEVADDSDAEELDFLKDLGGEDAFEAKKQKKKSKDKISAIDEGDDDNSVDGDWGDDPDDDDGNEDDEGDEDDEDDGNVDFDGEDFSEDEEGSIDMDDQEDDDEDMSHDDDDSDDSTAPKTIGSKRNAASLDERGFAKKLKHSNDMSSLFAAADDFAELLEETGKTKGQGTSNAIFNKDKSTPKQLLWEEKRRSGSKSYTSRSKQKGKFSKRK